ncbi:MAG: alpha/beta hydrolase [Chloroflexota bacterium]|nr:alpha/beta hydrolase [Chloroflexota bacterium]
MEPLFFGGPQQRLYGVHHPPSTRARSTAVLLCYPLVQEYNRTHWAFRRLAGMLSREGFHVLRFDYSGTGDSAGEYRAGSVKQWCANIREAATELKDLANVRQVSVIGMRLGATLAVLANSDGLAVHDLVLWDPAVDGASHIKELRRVERLKFGMSRQGPHANQRELLGYAFPIELSTDIQRVALDEVSRWPARRVLIFASEDRPEYTRLASHIEACTGKPQTLRVIPGEVSTGLEEVLLSTHILHAMTTALAGE